MSYDLLRWRILLLSRSFLLPHCTSDFLLFVPYISFTSLSRVANLRRETTLKTHGEVWPAAFTTFHVKATLKGLTLQRARQLTSLLHETFLLGSRIRVAPADSFGSTIHYFVLVSFSSLKFFFGEHPFLTCSAWNRQRISSGIPGRNVFINFSWLINALNMKIFTAQCVPYSSSALY